MREVLPPFTALVDCPAGHLSALSDAVESLLAQTYRTVEVTLCGLPRDARAAEHPQLERGTVLGPDRFATRARSWSRLHPEAS